jgi:RND family efflux transporter MFP subunit
MSVPESEVGKLKRGMDVSVFIPTLDENFEGKITIINPLADAISKTYSVKVLLKNNAGKLLPGMIAETNIKTGKSIDAVVVPVAVIVRDADGLTYVYVANQKNKAIRKRITVGSVTGNDDVIITSGLALGDKIVVAGQTHLKDGMDIRF